MTGKLTGRHDEANSSFFFRDSASARIIFNGSGVHAETRIFFSVNFDSLSKCPTLLSFFSSSRPKQQGTNRCCILAVHGITESVRQDSRSSARSQIKKSPVINRCYYCRGDYNRPCVLNLKTK